jgi:hypothetical protein
MADKETCEVGLTLAPLAKWSYNDVCFSVFITMVTFVTSATLVAFVMVAKFPVLS